MIHFHKAQNYRTTSNQCKEFIFFNLSQIQYNHVIVIIIRYKNMKCNYVYIAYFLSQFLSFPSWKMITILVFRFSYFERIYITKHLPTILLNTQESRIYYSAYLDIFNFLNISKSLLIYLCVDIIYQTSCNVPQNKHKKFTVTLTLLVQLKMYNKSLSYETILSLKIRWLILKKLSSA